MLLEQVQKQSQSQRIDPRLIQANNVLQLTTVELAHAVEEELLDNPALETIDHEGCAGDCLDPMACPHCSSHTPADAVTRGSVVAYGDSTNQARTTGDGHFTELDTVGNMRAEFTLREHLCSLLRSAVSDKDYRTGEYVVSCVDDRGWLEEPAAAIAADLGVAECEVRRLIDVIQSFDPPGVGAHNLRECLLLQLRFLKEEDPPTCDRRTVELAEELVRDHFTHIGTRTATGIARRIGASAHEIENATAFIRSHLNPYPASQFRPPWAYSPSAGTVVRPDVIVRKTRFGYEIEVVECDTTALYVNPSYREAYEQIRAGGGMFSDADKRHIVEHVERARAFLTNIEQRRKTLARISEWILNYQVGFVETGERRFIRSITRAHAAQGLKLHDSTVSRAISGKFIQLPSMDVIPFSMFFNSALSVVDAIEAIIHAEDPKKPLSDQQIAKLLDERGVHVARRTVVKYRESRSILSSSRRRR